MSPSKQSGMCPSPKWAILKKNPYKTRVLTDKLEEIIFAKENRKIIFVGVQMTRDNNSN